MSIISKKFLNAASGAVLMMAFANPYIAGAEGPAYGPQPEQGEKPVSRTFGPQLPAHTEKIEAGPHPQTRLRGEHSESLQLDAGKITIHATVESRDKLHALNPREGHVATTAAFLSLKF